MTEIVDDDQIEDEKQENLDEFQKLDKSLKIAMDEVRIETLESLSKMEKEQDNFILDNSKKMWELEKKMAQMDTAKKLRSYTDARVENCKTTLEEQMNKGS